MNKKLTLILLIVVFVLLLGGAYILYTQYRQEPPVTPPETETSADAIPAPDFTVYDTTGTPVLLSDYFGKPIILNFWASWCGPCRSEMPAFQQVYERYGQQVQFLMVNMTDGSRETQAVATEYIEDNGFTFPVLFDLQYDATITYQVYSLPTTVLIDANGNLLARQSGALSHNALDNAVKKLLP